MKNNNVVWSDVHQLPFSIDAEQMGWVYDADGNFAFRFLVQNQTLRNNLLNAINGVKPLGKDLGLSHSKGFITTRGGSNLLYVRSNGELIRIGNHYLSDSDGKNVERTLIDFIISRLQEK